MTCCQLKTRIDLTVEKSSQQYKISSVCGAGHSRNFVNADLIAAGLSPLSPDEEALEAGRLFCEKYIDSLPIGNHSHLKRLCPAEATCE